MTERKAAEAAREIAESIRRETDLRYRHLFESFTDGILICDRNTRILDVNPLFCEKLRCGPADLLGQRFSDLGHDGDWPAIAPAIATLSDTKRFVGKADLWAWDGTLVPIEFALSAVPDGNILAIVRDMSATRLLEAARRRAEEDLRNIQFELTRFSRNATVGEISSTILHEINQPLAALRASCEAAVRWLTRTPPDVREAQDTLQRIIAESDRANALVNRLRDFQEPAGPYFTEFDLEGAIAEVLALTRIDQTAHGARIDLNLARDAGLAYGDKLQIQHVIFTVVLRAFEATPRDTERPGAIMLRTARVGAGKLVFQVISGEASPPAAAAGEMAEPFSIGRAGRTDLGLAICRSIIEAHGGKLSEETTAQGGRSLWFTLPAGGPSRYRERAVSGPGSG